MLYCPNCKIPIIMEPLNCKIIRCGGYFKNNKFIQFPQHSSETKINELKKQKYIGCGIPLKYDNNSLKITDWKS